MRLLRTKQDSAAACILSPWALCGVRLRDSRRQFKCILQPNANRLRLIAGVSQYEDAFEWRAGCPPIPLEPRGIATNPVGILQHLGVGACPLCRLCKVVPIGFGQ